MLTSITLITLDQRDGNSGPVGELGRFAHRVVSPVSGVTSSLFDPVSDWFDGVVHDGSLKRENARLKRELSAARIEAEQGASDRAENKLLSELDGQPYLDDIPSVVGRIVSESPGNFDRTITLDHGTERGVKVGMPVVASGGLVGRVVQVWQGGCNVLLLDDPNFGVGVRMVNVRATGVALGQAGLSTLNLPLGGPLSTKKRPHVGEVAETSGLQHSTFPPGIPVGTVAGVSATDAGLSINVSIVPLVDIPDLEYVKVLLWTVGATVPPALRATTTTPTTTTTIPKPATTTTTRPNSTTPST